MERLWTEEETRWLGANMDRMDALSLARALKVPVAAVEAKVREQRAARAEAAARRTPATVREAERESSAARKAYEQGMELLRQKELARAAACFAEVVERYPDERELADRARTYLKLARGGNGGASRPCSAAELYHEAVFEKNRGNVRGALDLLADLDGAPDTDGRCRYLEACCLALTGDRPGALASLRAAVQAWPQNRIQARLEADLASLRGDPEFEAVVGRAS